MPIALALDTLHEELLADSTLPLRTSLSPADIVALAKVCLTYSYFEWQGKYYLQCKGGAMGNPLVAHMADITTNWALYSALQSWKYSRIPFCKRYVDDTASCLPESELDDLFMDHLNNQHPAIQWKFEKETEDTLSLPFLDLLIHRQPDGSIITSVYRKPTHSESYLKYHSCSPSSSKAAVVSTLVRRAFNLCHQSKLDDELHHIGQVLAANGYPPSFVLKTMLSMKTCLHKLLDQKVDIDPQQKHISNNSSRPSRTRKPPTRLQVGMPGASYEIEPPLPTQIHPASWPKILTPSPYKCSDPNHQSTLKALYPFPTTKIMSLWQV